MEASKALAIQTQAVALADQIAEFLPGGKEMPLQTRKALAYLAAAHGLDPWMGEVYAIPQKDKDSGAVMGWALCIGRNGWLRHAEQTARYGGHTYKWLSKEEALSLRLQPGDDAAKCLVYKSMPGSGRAAMEYEGFGVVKSWEKSRMNHWMLARKRALVDGLRQAFPIGMPRFEGVAPGLSAQVIDEDTGEVLQGGQAPALLEVGSMDLPAGTVEPTETTEPAEPAELWLPEAEAAASNAAPGSPAPGTGDQTPGHWIGHAASRNKFWAAASKAGFKPAGVHSLFGVNHMSDYPGTVDQAIASLQEAAAVRDVG